MVSINKLVAGAIVLFAALPAHAAAPASKEPASGKMFCCENGRICGDSFPERCRGKAYSILDAKGNLIREEPAPLTPQQKAEAAAEAQRKKDLEEHAREQRRQDQALLQTYTSAQDIDRSQARAELDVGAAIKGAEERLQQRASSARSSRMRPSSTRRSLCLPTWPRGCATPTTKSRRSRNFLTSRGRTWPASRPSTMRTASAMPN